MVYKFSVSGENHKCDKELNQDVVISKCNEKYAVIALADGVSSCLESRKGAEIACEELAVLLEKKGDYFFDYDNSKIAVLVMEHITYKLKQYASMLRIDVNELSSTLAGIIYDKKNKRSLYINLGDGMIMAINGSKCTTISKPVCFPEGCPVTTTKNAYKAVDVNVIDNCSFEAFIIMSDGAWSLFEGGKDVDDNIEIFVSDRNYKELAKYKNKKKGGDDSSFIVYDFEKPKGRLVA